MIVNKVVGVFGKQGTGKTYYSIKYIKKHLNEYNSIVVLSPSLIPTQNDLFIQKTNFEVDKYYRYSIFKTLSFENRIFNFLYKIEGKKILIIDEADLLISLTKRDDIDKLIVLRNNETDLIYISKRVKNLNKLLIQMTNIFVFFRYELIDDLEFLQKTKANLKLNIEKITKLENYKYEVYKTD